MHLGFSGFTGSDARLTKAESARCHREQILALLTPTYRTEIRRNVANANRARIVVALTGQNANQLTDLRKRRLPEYPK